MESGKQENTTLPSIARNVLNSVLNALVLCIALILPPSAHAANITSVLSMLLLDSSELMAAYRWNGEILASNEQPTIDAGSINTLTFDTSGLPQAVFENLQSIDIRLSGECYQIGGETLDPTIYEWSIVSTASGQCKIKLTFTANLNGKPVSNDLNIRITMNQIATPPPSIETLVSGADLSEGDAKVAGIFSINSIQKWTPPAPALQAGQSLTTVAASAFPDSYTPSIYEFRATHNGVALKGVMLSTRKVADPRNISDFDMDARTTVRFVGNTPVLVGSGVVQGMQSSPDNTFAFLAVAEGVSLPGPAIGDEFHIDGKNTLNVLCADQRLAGFGKFSVKRTGTRIASSLVGFTNKDCSGSGGRFKGTAGVFSDFQVVGTHIGRILRGRGTANPLHNGRITTTEDMDESDPDYALYMLGVPERLSNLHAITPVDTGTEFQDNVFILDPFTLSKIAKIRRDNGTMIFSEQPTQLLGISIGDIIVGKASTRLRHGLLRQVTQKGMQDGKFFLQTRPAKLDQLFKNGGITLSRNLALGDIEEEGIPLYEFDPTPVAVAAVGALREGATAPSLSSAQLSAAAREPYDNNTVSQANLDVLPFPRINFDHVFVDKDNNNSTKNDQIRTEGFFDLDAFITLRFRCHGFICGNPEFELSFTFEEDFELSGFASGDNSSGLDLKEVLKSKKFAPIWIGPVAITPKISLAVHLNGTSDTTIEWGIDQRFDATMGVELDDGVWSDIKNRSDEIIAAPLPNYTRDSGTVDLRARAALEGTVKVMGIKVGGVDAGIYTDVEASTPREPLWEITAGLNSEAFVELDLLVTTIEAGPWELFDIPFPITGGEAPNLPPEIEWIKVKGIKVANGEAHAVPGDNVDVEFLDGFFADANNDLKIKVNVFDPEFGNACCNVKLSSDKDGVIGTLNENDLNAHGSYVFTLNSLSSGLHTMTVKVWEKDKSPSTAFEETFTMRGRPNLVSTGCQDMSITSNKTGGVPDLTITYTATLTDGCVTLFGQNVTWEKRDSNSSFYQGLGVSSTVPEGGDLKAIYTATYTRDASFFIKAAHVNNAGTSIESNEIEIVLSSNSPYSNQGDSFVGNSYGSNFSFPAGAAPQSSLSEKSGNSVQPPLLAPSDTAPRKLGLDNWTVGETVVFQNPFFKEPNGYLMYDLRGYYNEVRWLTTDLNATITVNAAGDAQIVSGTPGWHKIQVALVNTASGKNIRKSELFYVSPENTKTWRGYSQDYLLQGIEAHPGGKIPVDNGEMMSGTMMGTNI